MGRTPQAWARRYEARKQVMQGYADKLGGTLEVSQVGGPGVPGGCGNYYTVVLPSGERLNRSEATRRALAKE